MLRHIEHLRTKPNHVKKQVALIVSLGTTLVIGIFWISSVNFMQSTKTSAVAEAAPPSPFAAASSNVASAFEGFSKIKDYIVTGLGNSTPTGEPTTVFTVSGK